MAKSSFAFFQSVFSSSSSAAVTAAEEPTILVQDSQTGDLSSYWEFVNASDADSSDSESVLSIENGFVSLQATTAAALVPDDVKEEEEDREGSAKEEEAAVVVADRGVVRRQIVVSDYTSYADHYSGLYGKKRSEEEEDLEEEEEEAEVDDDEYGLEDDLVYGQLQGRRMKKLGKRACAKMSNSKRDRYVKRGCLYSKLKA
ncbi:hypothetical protein LINGRAHAP2_LOCUS26324 [Linum grandiflorum]